MKDFVNNSVRRALIPVLAVLVTVGLSAAPAVATPSAGSGRAEQFPAVLNLPNGFSPEGLSINDGIAYTGSLADGRIRAIDLKSGRARQLAPSPGAARVAVGMDVDRFDRLWVAGGGPGFFPGVIPGYRVYDTTSGAKLADVTVPDAVFLNDVTVAHDAAWFTDSFSNALIRVPIRPNGKIGVPEKVTLGGDWAPSAGLNANGIVTTPDGKHLIVGQSQAADGSGGAFYTVPSDATGVANARRITLHGQLDSLAAGNDGLVLLGHTLYAANSAGVVKVELSRSLTAGQVIGTTAVPGAAWPTATKAFGPRLYVVDANYGDNFSNVGNPAATFKIVAIPRP
jgi:hypothetical protein